MLAALFGTDDWKALLFVGGMLILAFTALRIRSNSLSRQQRQRPQAPVPATVRPEQVRAMAEELSALLSEVQETARRVAAQIENRASALELRLAEADEKIRQLEALRRDLDSVAATPSVATADTRHARVYDLADRGHTAREIAQQLDMPPGEVELILNLRANPAQA